MPMSSQESPRRDSRLRLSSERSEPVSIPNPEFLRSQIGAELRSAAQPRRLSYAEPTAARPALHEHAATPKSVLKNFIVPFARAGMA
jgi:hypothetical protein